MQSFYEENNGWLYNKYGRIRQIRESLNTESCYESCYSLIIKTIIWFSPKPAIKKHNFELPFFFLSFILVNQGTFEPFGNKINIIQILGSIMMELPVKKNLDCSLHVS